MTLPELRLTAYYQRCPIKPRVPGIAHTPSLTTLHSHAHSHSQMTLHELRSTAYYQRRLIDRAVALLRPGGAMVYSTCSINPGELFY